MSNNMDSNLSNRDYHAMSSHWSSTALKYLHQTSPLHFKAKYIDKVLEQKPASDEMILGSLVHALVLTPDVIEKEFVFMPECDLRTKEGKAIRDNIIGVANGRTIVDDDIRERANAIAESVVSNKQANQMLYESEREVSYFWTCPFTGLSLRSRVDAINPMYLVELKTGRDMSPSQFQRSAYNMNYDLSAAHYMEGLRQNNSERKAMCFITVETVAPYVVQCYEVSPEFLSVGHAKWLDAITKLEAGITKGHWPGFYDPEVEPFPLLTPPVWAMKNVDKPVEDVGNGI